MKNFFSKDPVMLNLLGLVENVAVSRATLLLTGESGVGKEQLARHIHKISNRSKGPFVAVNCAALPYNLLESELFGFEKGAFTGAHQTKMGKIESAHDGTFLLDEISELPLDLQGKLLRVIQEKEVERLGSTQSKKIDVRFICTSNRDLREMVKAGTFRKDLFYRINVVPVNIPALRERNKDIEFYTHMFIEKICQDNGLTIKTILPEALTKLKSWSWPGNVRELMNVLERSVLVATSDSFGASDLHIDGYEESRVQIFGPGMTVQEAERLLIMKTLEHTGENRTRAAKLLGISVRTLRNKLHEYSNEGEINESGI
jgi:transcriptional regulator with PAS, ATPase and Fis domain